MPCIADTVRAELKNTGDKVEIQLKPEHLGKITIELTQTAGGIGLLIHADNAKTASLLAQHAGNLGALLEDRTGQHVQIQVPQQEHQQPQYDGHNLAAAGTAPEPSGAGAGNQPGRAGQLFRPAPSGTVPDGNRMTKRK